MLRVAFLNGCYRCKSLIAANTKFTFKNQSNIHRFYYYLQYTEPTCFPSDPYCDSYSDGCNVCSCTAREFPLCTMRACPNEKLFDEYCINCIEGYTLDKETNKCESEIRPTVLPRPILTVPSCGSISFCKRFAFIQFFINTRT